MNNIGQELLNQSNRPRGSGMKNAYEVQSGKKKKANNKIVKGTNGTQDVMTKTGMNTKCGYYGIQS